MLLLCLIGAGLVAVLVYSRLTRRSRMRAKGLREEAEMRRQSVKALAQILSRSNDSFGKLPGQVTSLQINGAAKWSLPRG